MESLSGWFAKNIFSGENSPGIPPVLTVIGSGGKTSLIWLLARSQRRQRVLVSPSTRMLIPPPEEGRYDRLAAGPAALSPGPGITLAGTPAGTGSKLEALPPDVLAAAVREYDLVLIEGDGSRGLPLKAWAAHEPVVPPFTTATAGIMPLWPLGLPASDRIIHRLPLFTALGGAAEGEPLRPEHLARVITGTGGAGRGLFTEARGARILFFNQIDDGDLRQAEGLAALLPPESPPALRWIIAGSVLRNRVSVIAP